MKALSNQSQLRIYSLLIFLISSFNVHAADSLKFINPWIPEAPPGASVMAGYMEIQNSTDKDIEIIGIRSESFASVEMHRSTESDGFAKMQPQKQLGIAAMSKLILTSGSYHLMLIKPAIWLKHGDKVKLDFTTSNHKTQTVEIYIKKNTSRTMKCSAGKCGAQ